MRTLRMQRSLLATLAASALVVAGAGMVTPTIAWAATLHCSPSTGTSHPNGAYKEPSTKLAAKNYTMKIVTNCGTIVATVDAKKAPITVRNFAFLAAKKFFDNTVCHRLTLPTTGLDVLQCGDPTATGTGGPGFNFKDENLPTNVAKNRYPAGTLAMANSGPNTNGSQFFLVYGTSAYDLPPSYTIWGHITSGLDILQAIAAKGVDNANSAGDGHPLQMVTIKSLTIK